MIDRRLKMTRNAIAVLATGLLAIAPALADKPDWAGEGGNAKPARMQKARADDDKARGGDRNGRDPRDGRDARDRADRDRGYARDERDAPRVRAYFRDRDRIAVHQYYAEQYRRGNCPPVWRRSATLACLRAWPSAGASASRCRAICAITTCRPRSSSNSARRPPPTATSGSPPTSC